MDEQLSDCPLLAGLLREQDCEVARTASAFEGLDLLASLHPDVVVMELRIPGLDGPTFMERVRDLTPTTRIVVMTEHGSVDSAVDAMKRGADDFFTKPFDLDALRGALGRAIERAALLREGDRGHEPYEGAAATLGVIGDHPAMRAALDRAEQVAPSRASVLLGGETGTGKSLVAETIHRMSDRRRGPFVEVACGALTDTLLDSELFGHEKGAFTGATTRREGRFMRATGGTLFLDEIASCPPPMQVKLLRFLQTRRFERVGGNQTLTADVRLLAATHTDLAAEVAAGRFREDLYYRLNVVQIHLPPLRQRRSDVPALAAAFLARYGEENGKRLDGFSRQASERLLAHNWPGNVRELEHAIEHAVVMARGSQVMPHDLPQTMARTPADPLDVEIPGSTLADIERAAILKSLMAVGGNARAAADMLGISKSKIYYRMKDYGKVGG